MALEDFSLLKSFMCRRFTLWNIWDSEAASSGLAASFFKIRGASFRVCFEGEDCVDLLDLFPLLALFGEVLGWRGSTTLTLLGEAALGER